MSNKNRFQLDPLRDLVLERVVDVPQKMIWDAWTIPQQVKKWFCPAPWKTVDCEIDLRPGGVFRTVMQSPEGEKFPNMGCYLEVVANERLVWTDALLPGYRPAISPQSGAGLFFTATISLATVTNGTKYTATVIHGSEEECKKHKDMGFHEGWGIALDQLVAHIKSLK